jgi:hypothetical protein
MADALLLQLVLCRNFDVIKRLAKCAFDIFAVFGTRDALKPPSIYSMYWINRPLSSYLMFDVRAPWGLSDSMSQIFKFVSSCRWGMGSRGK